VIIICIIYLLYVVIAKIRKKDYFDRKLVPVALFILVIGINSLRDDNRRLQYFQSEYAKLSTIYENQEYKISEASSMCNTWNLQKVIRQAILFRSIAW